MSSKSFALLPVFVVLLSVAGCGGLRQVRLDGTDEVFLSHGRASFPSSKAQCLEACKRVLLGSGHGVEREDGTAGVLVSGRKTVLRWVEATSSPTGKQAVGIERSVDNQFYVRVSGDAAACDVTVTRLRAWEGVQEQDTQTMSWTAAHLRIFTSNVGKELAAANP